VIAGNTTNIVELFKIKLDVVSTAGTVYAAEIMYIIKISYEGKLFYFISITKNLLVTKEVPKQYIAFKRNNFMLRKCIACKKYANIIANLPLLKPINLDL
jgi:YHS domain-containing protein